MSFNDDKFTFDGGPELIKVLHQLPLVFQEQSTVNAVRAGAKVIADEAIRRAPQRVGRKGINKYGKVLPAGTLKNSIKVKRMKKLAGEFSTASVVFSIGLLKDAYYGLMVEFGRSEGETAVSRKEKKQGITGRKFGEMKEQPFMRPAFDSKKQEALEVMAKRLAKNIETKAKQLAGSYKKVRKALLK